MTCAIGLEQDGRVWLGWDSASTDENYSQEIVRDPKGWVRDGWGFAFAGSWRCGQLLRHELRPTRRRATDVDRYITSVLVADIRAILARESDEERQALEMLIATKGRLFGFSAKTGMVLRNACGFDAVGSQEALAGMTLTAGRTDPERRLRAVLAAVAAHSANVRGPFTVIRV